MESSGIKGVQLLTQLTPFFNGEEKVSCDSNLLGHVD